MLNHINISKVNLMYQMDLYMCYYSSGEAWKAPVCFFLISSIPSLPPVATSICLLLLP